MNMEREMCRAFVLAAATVTFSAASAGAQSTTWTIDSSHSIAEFTVRHMMVSNVRGAFGKVTGTANWDGKNLATASVDVVIDAASIDTREPKRDAHLKSADFFDVEKFPTLTFKSTKVEAAGAGRAKMTGDLTIRGVTKTVVLDVTGPTPEVKDQGGNSRLGASATTTINRRDFGVLWNRSLDAGGVVVGDEVKITIEVELVKKAGA
jgi:polyisoprenoid-binding protein YceI